MCTGHFIAKMMYINTKDDIGAMLFYDTISENKRASRVAFFSFHTHTQRSTGDAHIPFHRIVLSTAKVFTKTLGVYASTMPI